MPANTPGSKLDLNSAADASSTLACSSHTQIILRVSLAYSFNSASDGRPEAVAEGDSLGIETAVLGIVEVVVVTLCDCELDSSPAPDCREASHSGRSPQLTTVASPSHYECSPVASDWVLQARHDSSARLMVRRLETTRRWLSGETDDSGTGSTDGFGTRRVLFECSRVCRNFAVRRALYSFFVSFSSSSVCE